MEAHPQAILWYKIYLGLLTLMYLAVMAAGAAFFFVPAHELDIEEGQKIFYGTLCLFIGAPFAIASMLPFFLRPRPWLWVYGIVMIGLGMTSCCLWPACIPLLIFWLKPDVQAYHGWGMATRSSVTLL